MNTPKPFDPTKPVRTRDGRAARIICTDAKGPYSIVAMVYSQDFNRETARQYNTAGNYEWSDDRQHDLVNIPDRIKREHWINVYPEGSCSHINSRRACTTRREADEVASHDRLACVRVEIDCEVGEGLEGK